MTAPLLDTPQTFTLPLAAQYGMPAEGLQITPLHLAENATYAIIEPGASVPRYVLRVYRSGRHSLERIHSELEWISALAAAGEPTPTPYRTTDGALTGTLALPDGQEARFAVLDYLPADDDIPDIGDTVAELGAAAARLQMHARTWQPPSFFDRPVWDITHTLTGATSWGGWLTADLPSDTAALLRDARTKILTDLPVPTPENLVLQHGDLKLGNSIWSGGVLHVIDFDDSGYSWPFYDLAATLTGMENLPDTPHLVAAWLHGYSQHAPIAPKDLASIPALLMQRRLMILGWLISHPDRHPDHDRGEVVADTVDMVHRYLNNTLLPSA